MKLHTATDAFHYVPHFAKLYDRAGQPVFAAESAATGINADYFLDGFNIKDPAQKSPYPKFVYLVMGYDCNHKCSYCMQRGFERRELPRDPATFLDLARRTPYLLSQVETFLFWGGEALLYWDEICEIITRLKAERLVNPGVKFLVSTNGSLMTPDKAAFLKEHDVRVVLSHDGPGQGLRSKDPLGPQNPVSRDVFLDLAAAGDGNLILTPTVHTGNLSRFDMLQHYASVFGQDFDLSIHAFSLFFLNDESRPFNPYLQDPLHAMLFSFTEYACGLAERFFDFNRTLARFAHRLEHQNYDMRQTFESNFDVSNTTRVRINLDGELTAFHIGDFSPRYVMGNIRNMSRLRLPEGEFMASSEAVRARCTNCPVLPLCAGGEPYIQPHLSDDDCLSKFAFYAPIWLYMLSVHVLKGPVVGISDGEFRHRPLLEKMLASPDYRAVLDRWS